MEFKRLSVLMALILVSTLGCEDGPSGLPPEGEQPAYLEHYGDGPRIQVPTEAVVGQTVEIWIQTYGGGCIQAGRTEVEVTSLRVHVRPYDVYPDPDAICTKDIRFLDHSVSVQLEAEGSYTVEVIGTRVYTGTDNERRIGPVSFEHEITVRSES
jgi:hypothetical protein